MDQPFLGIICAFGFNFAPYRWAACWGQIISIAQNQALFSLLGTMYGGNGQTTFALPDLRGRAAIGQGQSPGTSNYVMGQIGGTENVTLTNAHLPTHTHIASTNVTPTSQGAIVAGDAITPENNYLALSPKIGSGPNATTLKTYATPTAAIGNIKPIAGNAATATTTNAVAGSNIGFSILNPYLAVNYCIAMQGIFPSRN